MNIIKKTVDLGDGRLVEIETGKLAKQADGSVVLKYGKTMLLATVCADKNAKEGVDFMPLTVEYRENFAALGKYPGGFFKREGRPYEHEILTSRLVDRALRPLFPSDFHANVVVMLQLISADADELPDALACLAASAALACSDIPFAEPVSELRVARINGKFVINPKKSELASAATDMDMIIAATAENILMVEGEMKEVSEADMVAAIEFAHNVIKTHIAVIREFEAEKGTKVKRTYSHEKHNLDLKKKITDFAFERNKVIAAEGIANKDLRKEKFGAIEEEFITAYVAEVGADKAKEDAWLIAHYYHDVNKDAVRTVMLNEKKRLDGRKMDEVRPIWTEVDYLPGAHGSAIFTRGETQSLTTVTLGTKLDQQKIDGVVINEEKRLMLNYNFPGYSTGEARVPRGTGRREIGHGNLALRALQTVVPSDVPYTIRIVSDILESNGSSSMATVCAGTLALMDPGIKIKKPVSGIAMGLITDDKGNYAILSDILGDEDHMGDMDFKVCGTVDGITACQMDIKVEGLSQQVLMEALEQAKRGRLHILSEMNKTLSAPREDYKPHAPRVVVMKIDKEFIGAVIGTGGKVIQEIQATTGTTITIQEVDGKGIVEIFSPNKDGLEAAHRWIQSIVVTPEIGDVYEATVKSIMPYGAFVEFLPGKQGLLHISEVSHSRLETMEGVLKENEVVKVKLVGLDPKTGKFKLSRKVLLDPPAAN